MKTTDLFFDIVIIGFLTFLWISGFAFSYVISPSLAKPFLFSSSVSSLIIILITSYCLGIIFDYINSTIFSWFKSKDEKKLYEDMSVVKILAKNEKIYSLIENYYGKMRVLRSIVISIPLITWSFSCFIYLNVTNFKISPFSAVMVTIICGSILFVLSIISYRKRNIDYRKYIADLKQLYLP